MSLRSLTEKLNGIIEAVALVLVVAVGAIYGFSHLIELSAFLCLVIACISRASPHDNSMTGSARRSMLRTSAQVRASSTTILTLVIAMPCSSTNTTIETPRPTAFRTTD
jgi:hypothetical protein